MIVGISFWFFLALWFKYLTGVNWYRSLGTLFLKIKEKHILKVLLCQSDGEKMIRNVYCLQYTTGCPSNTVKTELKEPCIGQVLSLEKWKDNPGRKIYGNRIEKTYMCSFAALQLWFNKHNSGILQWAWWANLLYSWQELYDQIKLLSLSVEGSSAWIG